MKILDHLRQRRTVRRFKADPIPPQVRDAMLEAAMWAPSHANLQPWEFVIVGPQARARLLDVYRAKADELLADPDLPPPKRAGIAALREDFGGAPFMVAVVSRPPAEDLQRTENPLSAAAAAQNLCLAAWELGVGSVWLSVGASPPARAILGVKEGEAVVALLAMGYPAEVPPAPPREPFTAHLREIE
ncbi:MAG TPA: nitroreductase [Thermoanaerobaculales bacterium]|mgnify:CR=1 FL=1|nr:nitroreductase [Thermoanaerobaculales bacterium]HQL31431.1 nitroreductase [Thermoanaerobaculales bacterium]